jgi:DNA polymerase-3 subunit alpha
MRRYVRELRPSSVFDLAAMVALYRPGPMDNIPAYIRRKHGQEAVTYLHPLLEPYLGKTYGIFVYQEDIMAAAIALGGFTGPEADTLGYAIRKKKRNVLQAQKDRFVTQAAQRGVDAQVIDAVFKAFEPFERYGFNKAHATCYGLIAYQTAYLKANHTVEYMTAVLSAFRDSAEKIAAAIAECRRMGIEVRPPDVHRSSLHFSVEGDAIRFGLLAVKNVGEGAIQSIIDARDEGGPFKSLADLCTRVDLRLCNRKVLESLAKVGALDELGHPAQVLLGLDDALATGQAAQRDRISGQTSLFEMGGDELTILERPLPVVPETPMRERLRWEKELLGLYLSGHPMGEVANAISAYAQTYSGDLRSDPSLDGQRVVIGGIVTGVRMVLTKAKSTMLFAALEDLQGTLEVVVFPRTYEQTMALWREGTILLIAGKVDHRGEEVSLLADAVWDWDEAAARGPEAFAREVGSVERGRRRGANGNGNGHRAVSGGSERRAPFEVPTGPGPGMPVVSPLRADADLPAGGDGAALPAIVPPVPVPTYPEPVFASGDDADDHDEPPLPDEARAAAVAAAQAPSAALEAGPGQVLHVRFTRDAGTERVVDAMQAFRGLLRERPGATRVIVHVPAPGGSALPMELRGVAYDAELLAEVRRRLGEGVVELALG